MNTSRDIEKLFDHFGGNAGDYQEIGRENEARTARTRWPLLATLDFAQPAIPEIAPRRETQPNATRPRANEASPEASDKPTPILRGRQQLFMRAHRRTIPAVNPPAGETQGALRFSAMGESALNETGTSPASAPVVPAVQAPVAPVAPAENTPEAARPVATFGANFLARRTPGDAPFAHPASRVLQSAPAAARAPEPASTPAAAQSILGKLFKPQAQNPTPARGNSLDAMFERLRQADRERNEPGESAHTQSARAGRLSRS